MNAARQAHSANMRKRGREAWAKWRALVSEQKRSGQSAAAFCRERGICAPQFFACKKRLGQGRACTMKAKAFSFTPRTKVFADGTVRKNDA